MPAGREGQARRKEAIRPSPLPGRALRGGEVQVIDRRDGTLDVFGDRFVEVAPRLFENTKTEERLAFGHDGGGRIRYLFTEDLFLGNDTWERIPWYVLRTRTSSRRHHGASLRWAARIIR